MCGLLAKVLAIGSMVSGLGPDSNPPRFAIMTIPGFGGDVTTARGVNGQGHVAGSSFYASENTYRAYIYRDGVMSELPLLPEGRDAEGRAINDLDEVVGETYLMNGRLATATLWQTNGEPVDLDVWQSDFSQPHGVNSAAQVVGETRVEGVQHAVLWRQGEMIDLGVLSPYRSSTAFAVDASGIVVGGSAGGGPVAGRATKWINESIQELNWPMQSSSFASDINDQDQIVGTGDSGTQAVLWDNGAPSTLALRPNDTDATALHINNRSHIVGRVQRNNSGNSIYVIWPNAQAPYVEVQDLLPPQSLWRKIETVDDINDSAQMVGHGKRGPDSGLDAHGFLLTPVNWTFGLAAPSPGRAETTNTLRASGVTPGATVHFYYSAHGGGAVIPGCTIQSNAMQLEGPTLIGTATANGNGVASLSRYVPSIARNKSILFQAVVEGECAISQLVVHRFE